MTLINEWFYEKNNLYQHKIEDKGNQTCWWQIYKNQNIFMCTKGVSDNVKQSLLIKIHRNATKVCLFIFWGNLFLGVMC